jgi:hypothetical protein
MADQHRHDGDGGAQADAWQPMQHRPVGLMPAPLSLLGFCPDGHHDDPIIGCRRGWQNPSGACPDTS